MKRANIYAILVLTFVAGSGFVIPKLHGKFDGPSKQAQKLHYTEPPATLLKLPNGFHTEVVADNLGAARHLAVPHQGLVYVKLAKLKKGKGIIVLKDINGDGKADKETGFGNFIGTGIYIKDNSSFSHYTKFNQRSYGERL